MHRQSHVLTTFRIIMILFIVISILLNGCGMVTKKRLLTSERIPNENKVLYYTEYSAQIKSDKFILIKAVPYVESYYRKEYEKYRKGDFILTLCCISFPVSLIVPAVWDIAFLKEYYIGKEVVHEPAPPMSQKTVAIPFTNISICSNNTDEKMVLLQISCRQITIRIREC